MIIVLLKQDESHFFFADPYIFHLPHKVNPLSHGGEALCGYFLNFVRHYVTMLM